MPTFNERSGGVFTWISNIDRRVFNGTLGMWKIDPVDYEFKEDSKLFSLYIYSTECKQINKI